MVFDMERLRSGLNIVLPGPDGTWHVVVGGRLQSEVFGEEQKALERMRNILQGNTLRGMQPIAFSQFWRTPHGWEHRPQSLTSGPVPLKPAPRLIIEAQCNECAHFAGETLAPRLMVYAALRHVAESGHVIVLNGTADFPHAIPAPAVAV